MDDVHDLLDHEVHLTLTAPVVDNPDIFKTHQGLQNLVRLSKDEGGSGLLAHTASLRHLRSFLVPYRPLPSPR